MTISMTQSESLNTIISYKCGLDERGVMAFLERVGSEGLGAGWLASRCAASRIVGQRSNAKLLVIQEWGTA